VARHRRTPETRAKKPTKTRIHAIDRVAVPGASKMSMSKVATKTGTDSASRARPTAVWSP
jgi:hypothetical protein